MAKSRISPHDRYIRSIMSHQKAAQEFFELYIPKELKARMDMSSIKAEPPSFIDDKLRLQIADLLFSVRVDSKDSYVYALFEHASTPDWKLPFRILRYQIAIMDYHFKKNKNEKRIPFIYPLILYTGKEKWTCSTDLFDLFGEHADLARQFMFSPVNLVDLTKANEEELKQYSWFGTAALIARHINDEDFLPTFREFFWLLKKLDEMGATDYIITIISYVFEAAEVKDRKSFEKTIKQLGSIDEEKIMTLAEQWKQEGIEKGFEKGISQGLEKGKTEASHTIAMNLVKIGLSCQQISESTGLSVEEVEKLQKQIH